jgi:hypothetical protein
MSAGVNEGVITAILNDPATLASCFGVNAAQLKTIFPSLGAFSSANLGFV